MYSTGIGGRICHGWRKSVCKFRKSAVESEGRDNEGRPEGPPEDNVLRFPRDWFGSVDDLAPVGTSPRGAEVLKLGREPRPPEPAGASINAADLHAVATADDFWGEGSASLQHAVQPPRRRAADRVAAATPGREWPAARSAVGHRPRHRHVLLAAALLTVLAGVGILQIPADRRSFDSSDRGSWVMGAIGSQAAPDAVASIGSVRLAHAAGEASPAPRTRRRAGRRETRPSPSLVPPGSSSTAAPGAPTRASEIRAASETSYTPSPGSTAASGPGSVPTVSSYTAPAPAESGATTAAGPVGPGAAFGPGHMG